MGASASLGSNSSSVKKQSEEQTIAASLLILSKNVTSMEKLINTLDSCDDIEEYENKLADIRDHILRLIKDVTVDVENLTNFNDSIKTISAKKQLQKKEKKLQFNKELQAITKDFEFVEKLAAEKGEIIIRKKKQEMYMEKKTISALILIISKKVHSMKQIINKLSAENSEELLKQLDQFDHYTGLLIDDACDCIRKHTDSLVDAQKSISSDKQQLEPIELVNDISTIRDFDNLLQSLKKLDDEKQNVMEKVNELKTALQHKKSQK